MVSVNFGIHIYKFGSMRVQQEGIVGTRPDLIVMLSVLRWCMPRLQISKFHISLLF